MRVYHKEGAEIITPDGKVVRHRVALKRMGAYIIRDGDRCIGICVTKDVIEEYPLEPYWFERRMREVSAQDSGKTSIA